MSTEPISLRVLLVDDDANIRRTLSIGLKDLGCETEQASSADLAAQKLRAAPYDLVLSDFKMTGKTGMDVVREARIHRPEAVVVIMTAFASFENAVDVVKEGAFDYLPKPFTNAQLACLLNKVRTVVSLRKENRELKRGKELFAGFTSSASRNLEDFVRKAAPTEGTVLLSGESGTGKSELARVIHQLSPRAKKPFVTIYCTTLAESLLESELFGHVKGAFTGATSDHTGKLELAHGGTLFLDEIGDLSAAGQAKLLRFLQERIFERIGGHEEISVDARVIAATNKGLAEAVAKGAFREDLYYRLNVLECVVAPLRHRRDDLPVLIERLLSEMRSRGTGGALELSPEVTEILLAYSWPGNVRELRNVLERLAMLSQGRAARVSDLPRLDCASPPRTLEEVEKRHIETVLTTAKNLEEAAGTLGITTVTLWRKRKEFGLA